MTKLRVAVLTGGVSAEREISLASGKEVIKALRESGKYDVKVYDPKNELGKFVKDKDDIDVVIPVLHGPFGEDGTIQAILEFYKLPYAFSDDLASALGINKLASHRIFERAGILVPKYTAVRSDISDISISQIILPSLFYPLVVKPNTQGSSIGVSICKNQGELKKGLKKAFKYDKTVLIEQYIKGTEITAGVLGRDQNLLALPITEIIPKKQFFDYEAKYDGSTEEIVPARISEGLTKKAQSIAKKAHQLLGCSGVTRTDMIIDKDNNIYVLEINTIPGFTKESLIPKAAKAAGISFENLLEKLIDLAKEGQNAEKI